MLLKITSFVAGIFALSAFLGLFLPIVHTSCMVFQTNRTSIFMVAFFTVINCAFMAMFFVTWKICDSSSFVAAEIAMKSYTLMGGLCVYCQMVLQFCFVFTMFTFISHTILHCSLWLFRFAFLFNVFLHHLPDPTATIFRHTFWKKKTPPCSNFWKPFGPFSLLDFFLCALPVYIVYVSFQCVWNLHRCYTDALHNDKDDLCHIGGVFNALRRIQYVLDTPHGGIYYKRI